MDNFRMKVYKHLRNSADALKPKMDEISELQEKIDSGYYSQDAIAKDMKPRIDAMKAEIKKAGHEAILSAKMLVDQHRRDVEAAEQLDASEINDRDMKLMSTGLLRAGDLESLLARNVGNHTMTVLGMRYAEEHGLEISQEARARVLATHNAAFEEINTVNEAVQSFEKWIASPDSVSVLNKFFGITEEQAQTAIEEMTVLS